MEPFINEAIKQAMLSQIEHKHGCVIVYKNKIIAKGHNRYIYNCYNNTKTLNSLHAEMVCVSQCKKYAKKIFPQSTLIVVRIKNELLEHKIKNDQNLYQDFKHLLKLSKPCCICDKIIKLYKFKTIIYST